MVNAISTALSGMGAALKKLNASASNIVNMGTTGSLETGGQAPYRAVTTTQKAGTAGHGEGAGVSAQIVPKDPGFSPAYDPGSPFANEDGLIGVPDVSLAEEAVRMQIAETAYKASAQSLKVASEITEETMNILDEDARYRQPANLDVSE